MIKPQLTKEIAYKALQNFFLEKPFVLFATGTSCAIDIDFGMPSLEQYLKDAILKTDLSLQQQKEWDSVLNMLEKKTDFETAMDAINDETLLRLIINKTAQHVFDVDKKNAIHILKGEKSWSAVNMFKRLVERLPETDRTLHVATPNYDMMAEYAFAHANIDYTTGFWGGVIRKMDWIQAERQMTYAEKVPSGRSKINTITRQKKHLRLYKVHGSLNTFGFNNQVIETDIWHDIPNGVERLMITPGMSKMCKLHDYRDALLGEYDRAIKAHSAFLFLGFGFNDTQLVNNSIKDKLTNQGFPGLIITRDSNRRIEALLSESKNTWLVCKHCENDSTMIYNSNYQDGLNLADKKIWKFDIFATEIMGG